MNFIWQLKKQQDPSIVQTLKDQIGVDDTIANMLAERGLKNFDQAKSYFNPKVDDLLDPLMMKGMQKALDRILIALNKEEKIMIYGDYDVDGSTSVAMMTSFFQKLQSDVIFYQPDRYLEGYGISFTGIDHAKNEKVSLIIALDCGTRAINQIQRAKDFGIDVIVCDHHTPGEELPEAFAILNPKQKGCTYPFKELCGCGIGFKVIQAFAQHQGWSFGEIEEYLDFVTVAIGADIVPIIEENRSLAYLGLKIVNESPRLGIKKLLASNNKIKDISITDLVFTVAPRINAAGRISHASAAVELLLVDNEDDAERWCEKINEYNQERRELDKTITIEALEKINNDKFYNSSVSNVIWDKTWHKGVVGIVASRVIENSYKPTIVLAISGDEATGSARSVKGFNVLDAISACGDLLTKFGGHKYAAGLSLKVENLEVFRAKFDHVVRQKIKEENKQPIILIDSEISPTQLLPDSAKSIFPKLYRITERFAPFGPQNMKPTYVLRNLMDTGYSKIVGEDHLKFSLKTKDGNDIFNGIGFGLGQKINLLEDQKEVDIAFNLDKNEFRGNVSLQLMIKDIQPSKSF